MALIPIKFTKRGRLTSSLLLLILTSFQAICGIIFLCIGSYIFFYIENGLVSYTKYQLSNLVFFLTTTSTIIFIVASTGFKCITNLSAQPTNHSTTRLHWIWLLFSMIMVLFLISFTLMLPELTEELKKSLTLTLNHGLTHYYKHNTWKGMTDNLQQFHKCCGIQQYTDWYRTSWLNTNDLPQDPELLHKYAQANSLVIVPVVPSSCCKLPESICGEKTLSNNKGMTGWNEIKPTDPSTIYTQGCLPIILYKHCICLFVLQILLTFTIIVQCIVMVILRYLITSTRNTILLGNPNGSATGWLFGRGDLCCNWGKTLPEHDPEIFKDDSEDGDKTSIHEIEVQGLSHTSTSYEEDEINIVEHEELSDEDDGRRKSKVITKSNLAQKKVKPLKEKTPGRTDAESDKLKKDVRIPVRFKSKNMRTNRHDDILNAANMKRANTDDDCSDCDEFGFGSETPQYQQVTNKISSDKKKLISKKKTNEKTVIIGYSRGNVKQPTDFTESKFENHNEQAVFKISTDSLILKNFGDSSVEEHEKFLNETTNELMDTENYNVETQTSQLNLTQTQEKPQTAKVGSDTTVFRNYVMPNKFRNWKNNIEK